MKIFQMTTEKKKRIFIDAMTLMNIFLFVFVPFRF